jgi:hypothetical protein
VLSLAGMSPSSFQPAFFEPVTSSTILATPEMSSSQTA